MYLGITIGGCLEELSRTKGTLGSVVLLVPVRVANWLVNALF